MRIASRQSPTTSTGTGPGPSLHEPLPSWPQEFEPQHATAPAAVRAHVCRWPRGSEEARTIHGIQQHAERVTGVMFGLTVAGAVIAAFLTLRLLRRTDRDAALYERTLQDWADELEGKNPREKLAAARTKKLAAWAKGKG
jgi:hypothetical protein